MKAVAATLCLLLAIVCPTLADEPLPQVMPPASWVAPQKFAKGPDLQDSATESRWLLVDQQINAANDERFFHFANQVLTPSGVQKNSHIAVNYDPSFETLAFHWVQVWRGGNASSRLDPKKIRMTQSGLDTDTFIFSSDKTATLLLDDVRSGDIIEYAYTIKGRNPALDGKFTGQIGLQYSEPVELCFSRLIWPRPRLLYIQNHNTEVKPRVFSRTNLTEFIWTAQHTPALRLEPDTPSSHDPYAWVQLSEFRQWSDVNKWALPLFASTNAFEGELAQKIREWKALPQAEDRLLTALRFVQEEIRYLGLEGGASGFEPTNASAVFARRYGDCKDKTLLLVTILRALKIEAYPVLVNTVRRQGVAELHASPTVFDHAITAATLDGQTYWLDATATYERGPLSLRSWPPYGVGLLIRPGATSLAQIPPCPVISKMAVTQHFQIGNLNAESTLRITTEAEGPAANALRAQFASTPREELERDYLNAQAAFYPDIRTNEALSFSDDEELNRVQIVESYAVEKMWSHLPDDTVYRCNFYSHVVNPLLSKPEVSFRTMPLAIPGPVQRTSRIEASLPAPCPINTGTQRVENPAFTFRRTIAINDGQLIVEHDYRSQSEVVLPAALPEYLHQLDAAQEMLNYQLVSY